MGNQRPESTKNSQRNGRKSKMENKYHTVTTFFQIQSNRHKIPLHLQYILALYAIFKFYVNLNGNLAFSLVSKKVTF